MRQLLALSVCALVLAAPRAAADEAFDARCRAAIAPYYAALLASARGDTEGTLRQLVVLKARWSDVQATPAAARPAWTGSVLDVIASRIDSARARASARNVVAAHGDLESIRALLRDARARAGVRTFDDAVTDYHEALERLTGRAGLHHEIALNAEDYTAIEAQLAKAAAMWTEIEATAGALKGTSAWTGVSGATLHDLAALRSAVSKHDMDLTQSAAEELKTHYFSLLALLARG